MTTLTGRRQPAVAGRIEDLDRDGQILVERAKPLLLGIYARKFVEDELVVLPGGTGFFIAPDLVLTAKHVTQYFGRRWDPAHARRRRGVTFAAPYHVAAFHIMDPNKGSYWQVDEMWPAQFTDIALLHLIPEEGGAREELKTRPFRWRLLPPPKGATVTLLGVPDATLSVEGKTLSIDCTVEVLHRATVTEIFEPVRGTGMCNFPCFEIDQRVDPGFSGGPVFYNNELCGVLSAASDYEGSEQCSWVASLWPLLSMSYDGRVAYELFNNRVVDAPGWSRVCGAMSYGAYRRDGSFVVPEASREFYVERDVAASEPPLVRRPGRVREQSSE